MQEAPLLDAVLAEKPFPVSVLLEVSHLYGVRLAWRKVGLLENARVAVVEGPLWRQIGGRSSQDSA